MHAVTPAYPAALLIPAKPSPSRVATWLALSIALHASLLLLAGPSTPRPVGRPAPLLVELRPAPAEPDAVIAAPPTAPETVALPQTPFIPAPSTDITPSPKPPAAATQRPVEPAFPIERYFSGRDVDVRAEPLNEVELVYPEKALLYRTAGSVIVTFFINEHGGVDHIDLGDAKPPGIFEEAALEAARALQFAPALKNGRAVKSRKTIEVTFDPYNRAAAAPAPAPIPR